MTHLVARCVSRLDAHFSRLAPTDESTRTLRLTQTFYDNYTSLLETSSHLVKAIERADWYDRLLIFSAFFLFLLVVGYVIKQRVLDKVVGGVGWWVGGSAKLVMMGLGGGTRAVPKVIPPIPIPSLKEVEKEQAEQAERGERGDQRHSLLDQVVPPDRDSSAVSEPEPNQPQDEV